MMPFMLLLLLRPTPTLAATTYNTPWSIPKGGGGGQTRHLLSAVFTISSAVGAHTLSTADKISLESLVAGVTIS